MKTISITGYNRPQYLREVLDAIKVNDVSGYHLVCSLEPGCKAVVDMCNSIDFIDKTIIVNEKKLGVRQNPYNAINYAFNVLGSEFNIIQEDDVTLSPDFFDLANWYYDNFKNNPTKYMSYGMFNYDSSPQFPNELIEINSFTGLGWCCFKENWDICYNKWWFNDEITKRNSMGSGWDWASTAAFKEFGYKGLIPKYARSNHIGRLSGTHCLPTFHDQKFVNLDYNKTLKIKEYIVT